MNMDRILVGLAIEDADISLIKYVKNLADIIKPSKIDFIHVSESFESDITELENFIPVDEEKEQQMRKEVALYFDKEDVETQFEVVEGKPDEKLIHWASVKKSDLIILGRKNDKKHAELTLEKIVRKVPCSVLIVPENAAPTFNQFLLPIDYSANTLDGINYVQGLFNDTSIQALHFFDLPSGYYKTGKSAEEFITILDNNRKKESEKLLTKVSNAANVTFKNICSDGMDEFEHLLDYANKQKTDLIAIRSKGKTNAAAVLLGSFAEKFIRHNRSVPTLVIKEKGENMDFLKALFNL